MTNLVSQLRSLSEAYKPNDYDFCLAQEDVDCLTSAADEIERLQHDLEKAMANHAADIAPLKHQDECPRCGNLYWDYERGSPAEPQSEPQTCGCVQACEPESLQPGEVCVNTLSVKSGAPTE